MMVDLYSLPEDFPGYHAARAMADPLAQAADLQRALAEELNDTRFVPYLQVHEFEALLLVRPDLIADLYDAPAGDVSQLEADVAAFASPEHVDHGQHSHPKARLKLCFPDYDENVAGPLLAEAIGLPELRTKCRHFGDWLTRLEQLDR
jgi:hypothetical protein